MKGKFCWAVFFTLTLSGCASRYIGNAQGLANLRKDEYDCELSSRAYTIPQQNTSIFEDMRYSGEKGDLYSRCMAARGYYYYTK